MPDTRQRVHRVNPACTGPPRAVASMTCMSAHAPPRDGDTERVTSPRLVPAAEPLPGMPTPPPRDPETRLSFSRVDTYERCPLLFRFRYVDKLPSTPSPDLSWGSSIHAALEAWWDQKLPTLSLIHI